MFNGGKGVVHNYFKNIVWLFRKLKFSEALPLAIVNLGFLGGFGEASSSSEFEGCGNRDSLGLAYAVVLHHVADAQL